MVTVAGSHLRGFRGIAGESKLRPRIVAADVTTRYFMRCRDDGYVSAVVVWNPVGEMVVFTRAADGSGLRWGCRHTGDDEITFFPHPAYRHTKTCIDCKGAKVLGIDPVTNPLGSVCRNCEGSGELPNTVCLVTEKYVKAERIYIEPTRTWAFLNQSGDR